MNKEIRNIVLSGLFISIGIILPPLVGGLGQVVSPIHFPVILCGLLLGWKYGLLVGLVTPPLVSLMWGQLPIFPLAVIMSIECAAYGAISGLLFKKLKLFKNQITNLYFSLITTMVIGRIVYLLVVGIMFIFGVKVNTFAFYITALFATSLPGIILQILVIPPIVIIIENEEGKGIA